jgi:NADPH-dependent 2,4-dienoyl-CoA reductase/sulfur reductase-like enzyme
MPHYNYLIIGGGMTADAAVKGIREVDTNGSIGLISAGSYPPYNRPPLSKGLWKGKPVATIWRGTEEKDAELHLGLKAQRLDPANRRVTDEQGNTYTYDKLLLATGGKPRELPFGSEHIIYYRTFSDYEQLRALADKGRRFAVIGGGFIGSEIAAALTMNNQEVVMIFPESGIGARLFPQELSDFLNDYYREKGVQVLAEELVQGLKTRDNKVVLTTQSGQEIVVDNVVAGIGIIPDVALAQQAGIETDNGIVVDDYLRTNQADIYAAGDVAFFYSPHLKKRLRVEHEDNANTMGRIAGLNMAGQATPYHHLPFFYSDLFDLGYEAVGDLDSRLTTIADWQEPNHKGVIYYLADNRVQGVLLWNVWDKVEAARELIAASGPFQAQDLQGRL